MLLAAAIRMPAVRRRRGEIHRREIVAEYRAMEKQVEDNDVGLARLRISRGECGAFQRERIREKIRGMSEEKFNAAHARLNELREEAIKLVRPIFERLVEEFDKELNAVALQRESELQAMGIPLYSDRLDSAGYPSREFPVHADPIVTGWQCRRECVRNSALHIDGGNAIGAVQFLCTAESPVPFHWL
jgi:hypothetical protein